MSDSAVHVEGVFKRFGKTTALAGVALDVEETTPFYRWAWEQGYVSADTYLAFSPVPPPGEVTRRAQPRPYSRSEVAALWAALDDRWPKLVPDEEAKWDR
jgi:hypothetical protein